MVTFGNIHYFQFFEFGFVLLVIYAVCQDNSSVNTPPPPPPKEKHYILLFSKSDGTSVISHIYKKGNFEERRRESNCTAHVDQ